MKKIASIVLFVLLCSVLSAQSKRWNPVQYVLEWNVVPGAEYELFRSGQAMNDGYFTKDTNGEYTVFIVNTNKDFSPWFSTRYQTNTINALQGTAHAAIRYYVVVVTNNVMYKTSNIVSWPTNWTTKSTNGFELTLRRIPLGPPMYYGPPYPPPAGFTPTRQ